jgi:hypothetical protein
VETAVRDAKHAARWLQKVARSPEKYPLVVKVVKNHTSPRGLYAKRNKINLFQIIRLGTPEWLERKMRAVRKRCEEILAPFPPMERKLPWYKVMLALCESKRTGKAAVVAAAMALGASKEFPFKGFRCWREALERICSCSKVVNTVDGKEVKLGTEVFCPADKNLRVFVSRGDRLGLPPVVEFAVEEDGKYRTIISSWRGGQSSDDDIIIHKASWGEYYSRHPRG